MDKNAQKRGPGLLRGAEPGAAAWETARRLLETQTQNLHMVCSFSCWMSPAPQVGAAGPRTGTCSQRPNAGARITCGEVDSPCGHGHRAIVSLAEGGAGHS